MILPLQTLPLKDHCRIAKTLPELDPDGNTYCMHKLVSNFETYLCVSTGKLLQGWFKVSMTEKPMGGVIFVLLLSAKGIWQQIGSCCCFNIGRL